MKCKSPLLEQAIMFPIEHSVLAKFQQENSEARIGRSDFREDGTLRNQIEKNCLGKGEPPRGRHPQSARVPSGIESGQSGQVINLAPVPSFVPFGDTMPPEFFIRHHIDDIYACINGNLFKRKLLRLAVIERWAIQQCCIARGIPMPEFWFPPG